MINLQDKANKLRQDTLALCIHAGTGHVTSCMSCAEILTVLYYGDVMKHDPQNPKLPDRDWFILSKGQASPILYATLADRGFIPNEWLNQFVVGKDGHGSNAPFGVHLQCTVPGVEFTTGSLGHGLGYAAGVAKTMKMNGSNSFVFVLLGDAELYEGSNWEVSVFAAHHKLDNLIAIVDRNAMGVNGYTEQINALEPLARKFDAFGWHAVSIDGHSITELYDAIIAVKEGNSNRAPTAIIAHTVKGKGIESMIGKMHLHGTAPSGSDAVRAMVELEQYRKEQLQ